jgi:hypothetical protein
MYDASGFHEMFFLDEMATIILVTPRPWKFSI